MHKVLAENIEFKESSELVDDFQTCMVTSYYRVFIC